MLLMFLVKTYRQLNMNIIGVREIYLNLQSAPIARKRAGRPNVWLVNNDFESIFIPFYQ